MNFIFCKLKKPQKTWISFFASLKTSKNINCIFCKIKKPQRTWISFQYSLIFVSVVSWQKSWFFNTSRVGSYFNLLSWLLAACSFSLLEVYQGASWTDELFFNVKIACWLFFEFTCRSLAPGASWLCLQERLFGDLRWRSAGPATRPDHWEW